MTDTPKLGLTYLEAAQAQKHVGVNDALRRLDGVVQAGVIDKDLSAPPAGPATGDAYIVGAAPSGLWAGKAGNLAIWHDTAWFFYAPSAGWRCYVTDEDGFYIYNGATWNKFTASPSDYVGWEDYNDATTATTPIALSANVWTKLTNDGAGAFTNTAYKLTGYTPIWDTANNRLDFTSLSLGDVAVSRVDVTVTTTNNNTDITLRVKLGVGGATYTLPFFAKDFKVPGTYQIVVPVDYYMGDLNTLQNYGEFEILSDTAGASVVVNGWFTRYFKR